MRICKVISPIKVSGVHLVKKFYLYFYRYHYELVKGVFSQKTLCSLGKSVGQSLEEQPDPIDQLGSDFDDDFSDFEDDEHDREQSVSTNLTNY